MLQSIATCWPLLCLNEESRNNLVTSLRNICRTWSQCMLGRVFTPLAWENMAVDTRQIYKSKTSSHFPNFDTTTLGKWATTHERVSFLGKNCSWTLLPGAIWLRTPIKRLQYISCLRSFRTHFDSLKHADDLRVYRGFMMPLNHQAGIQGTLTQCLRY